MERSSGEIRIDRMLRDHPAETSDLAHGGFEELCVGDRVAVVGEQPYPRPPHLVEVGEAATGPARGQGARWQNVDQTDLATPRGHEPGQVSVVDGRRRVRHRHHRRVAAGRCGLRARSDVLFVRSARLPQVRVQVDQSGPHPAARAVDLPLVSNPDEIRLDVDHLTP